MTIDFGEGVTGFAVGDLTVAGATKASNWQSGKSGPAEYTITLTPTTANGSTGTVTIDVDADVATDGANGNEAASQVTVEIDKDAPTLTIDAPSDPQNGPFDVTFTFDQDVIDFEPSDVTVTNANKASSWKSEYGDDLRPETYPNCYSGGRRDGDDRCRSGWCDRCC